MKPKTLTTPLLWEGKGEGPHTSAAKNVRRPVSVIFGQKSSALLSKSELQSLLRSGWREGCRKIELIVLHCSDTKPSQDFTIDKLIASHKKAGFGDYPGYHFYVRRDGHLYYCRPISMKGCHVSGYNTISIGVCSEGGHRDDPPQIPVGDMTDLAKLENGAAVSPPTRGIKGVSNYEDNRTAEQLVVLHDLLTCLHEMFPSAKILGHRDLPGVKKACPCYDAAKEYAYILE